MPDEEFNQEGANQQPGDMGGDDEPMSGPGGPGGPGGADESSGTGLVVILIIVLIIIAGAFWLSGSQAPAPTNNEPANQPAENQPAEQTEEPGTTTQDLGNTNPEGTTTDEGDTTGTNAPTPQ